MSGRFILGADRPSSTKSMFAAICVMMTIICLAGDITCLAAQDRGVTLEQKSQTERFDRGSKALEQLAPEAWESVKRNLKDIAPEMADFVIEFAYGDIYSRPGLDPKSRQVATIAALTAMGNARPQLGFHIGAGLNAGLSAQEIIEVMYVTTVFAGFPAGLNGIEAAREVFRSKAVEFNPPTPGESASSRRERGLATLNRSSKSAGERVIESLGDIASEMADFIIDFSYGDIFSRDILSPQHKEIAMIAVCVAKGTMAPQMRVHIHAALNVGLTRRHIVELMNHMAVYAGFPAALNGLGEARKVFEEVGEE